MVEAARQRGLKYIAITDHSKSLGVAGGLSDADLMRHTDEVRALDAKYSDIRVLAGTEVDIRQDGSLDYSDELLAKLDFVVASVHSGFRMDRAAMTARVVQAMQNPHVRAIGHPTGRLIGDRESYDLDFDILMREASRTRTCLEVNSNYHRLDLSDTLCRKAREMNVHVVINSDAHNRDDLDSLPFGVATAQRGWIEKDRVLNSRPVEELLAFKE
jgi:DNA polymerase (family 10)